MVENLPGRAKARPGLFFLRVACSHAPPRAANPPPTIIGFGFRHPCPTQPRSLDRRGGSRRLARRLCVAHGALKSVVSGHGFAGVKLGDRRADFVRQLPRRQSIHGCASCAGLGCGAFWSRWSCAGVPATAVARTARRGRGGRFFRCRDYVFRDQPVFARWFGD